MMMHDFNNDNGDDVCMIDGDDVCMMMMIVMMMMMIMMMIFEYFDCIIVSLYSFPLQLCFVL